MKKLFLFAGLSVGLLLTPAAVTGQESSPLPSYVVIGAFQYRNNAVNFTDDATRHNFPAKFEMNPDRNLYYVYVLTTYDRDVAIAEAVRLRADTKYFDAWVYSGAWGKGQLAANESIPDVDIDPLTGAPITARASDSPEQVAAEMVTPSARGEGAEKQTNQPVPGNSARQIETTTEMATVVSERTLLPDESVAEPKPLTPAPLQSDDVAGRNFYFHLFRGDNGSTIDGDVDAIDFARSRKMATYPANESVSIHIPTGDSKHISFICQVFGYRKAQREYDPTAPPEDLYLDDQGNIVMPFELMRLQKGDIAVMYNVFFFKDAAVMRPESRYEVNNLLEMLQENPTYEVTIHGHTNGNAGGRIIRMDTPGNFYSLTGTKEGVGSAKKLSEERAEVIKRFLVHNGIDEARMTVKAWGGKKPLFDPRSARASENVRVEIEIMPE